MTWFRLCDDMGSWNYNRLKLEFHQKFYPMHLVHRDCNYIYIYNFWPHEGESISQSWGRLKSMLYSCPSLGSTLLLIERTTIDPLYLWVLTVTGKEHRKLNPKLSTSPIARKINLVGQTKLIIRRDLQR